ncbi:hypothetical protein DSUL_150045 [Desulfovibrionales bacterium]
MFMTEQHTAPFCSRFLHRHTRLFLAGLVFVVGLGLGLVTELVLRFVGYLPGNEYLPFVERLEVVPSFFTDEHGFFRANATFPWADDVHINVDGFRSPPFISEKKLTSSILLLGDSFVWGASAKPLTSSFADLLRAEGMAVHNTGIPGTGPTQYLAIAERQVPQLRPEVIVAAIFLGNDLMDKPDRLQPWKNLFHVTNAGWISGFDEAGNALSAHQAYDYYIATPKRRLQHLFFRTSLGTACWKSVFNFKQALARWQEQTQLVIVLSPPAVAGLAGVADMTSARADPVVVDSPSIRRYPETRRCLLGIQRIAEVVGARFFVLPIPSKGLFCKKLELAEVADLFVGLAVVPLDGLTDAHYTAAPDCHLNETGHVLVKDALSQILVKGVQVQVKAKESSVHIIDR